MKSRKKALKRLGVAGVATATAAIGLPATGIMAASADAATTGVPGAPTDVTITNDGAGYVTLNWKAPTTGGAVSGYNVLEGSSSGNENPNPLTGAVLIKGTSYTTNDVSNPAYFEVEAVNAAGVSTPSAEQTIDLSTATPVTPGAPTGLKATATANDTVDLSWTAPTNTGGPAQSPPTYQVGYATTTGGETNWSTAPVADNGTGTTATITGLTAGTTYYFEVETTNGNDPVSTPSAEASATTLSTPSAPALSVVADDTTANSVTLDWSPAASGPAATGYNVYMGTSAGGESTTPYNGNVPLSGTTLTVPGLTAGKTYYFTVKAVGATGDSPASNEVSATPTVTAPSAPTGLTATAGYQSAQLSWTKPASSGNSAIASYQVLVGTSSGSESATLPTGVTATYNGTTASVSGLTEGTKYYFTVEAVNSDNLTSPASNEASATPTLTAPGAPTGLTATNPSSGTTFDLSWTAPTNLGGPSGVTYSIFEGKPGSGTAVDTDIATPGTTAAPVTITAPAPGSYEYYVEAVNGTGSTASSPVTIATGATVPAAPTGLAASVASSTSVDLSWDAPGDQGASAVTGYTVLVGTTSSNESATLPTGVTATVTGTTATVNGLTAGTAYYFTVEAVNGNTPGTSAPSAAVSATPAAAPSAPSVTYKVGNGSLTLDWTAPADNGSAITGYQVYEGTPGNGTALQLVTGTSTTITGLTNGTTYSYYVEAVNGIGSSGPSDAVVATPAPVAPSAPTALTASSSGPLVNLSWKAPATDGGSPVLGYDIWVSPDPGVTPGPGNEDYSDEIGSTTGTSATLDLYDYYDYYYGYVDEPLYFAVTAINAPGESSVSNVASATVTQPTAPSAPSGVMATAEVDSARLTWTTPDDNGSPILGYVVTPYLDGVAQTATTFGDVKTGIVTGLKSGQRYTFTVKAQNVVGNSPASTFTNTVTVKSPSIATAFRTGPGEVTVSGQVQPGATVELYGRAHGKSYSVWRRATTNATTGAFSFRVRVADTTDFYAEADGVKTKTVVAGVRDIVSLALSSTKKNQVVATVHTSPAVSGQTVTYEFAGIKRTAKTNSKGVATHTINTTATTVTVRAVLSGGDGSYGGTSPTRTIRVKK